MYLTFVNNCLYDDRGQTSNRSGEAIKLLHKQVSNKLIKTVYQKDTHVNTFVREGYAPPVWKEAQVQGLNEFLLTIRGARIRALSPLRMFLKLINVTIGLFKSLSSHI